MSKSNKYFIIGTLLAGLSGTAVLITGVSDHQVEKTAAKEGYTPKATIPVKGDVPTIGHGTTVYPSGVRVKMSDPAITRKQAFDYLKYHMDKDSVPFNKTLQGVKLSQKEYDLYFDFVYQFGIANWRSSSMLSSLKKGDYIQACESLLKWKYVAKRDCSIRSNGCYGVWTRQQERHKICIGENQ